MDQESDAAAHHQDYLAHLRQKNQRAFREALARNAGLWATTEQAGASPEEAPWPSLVNEAQESKPPTADHGKSLSADYYLCLRRLNSAYARAITRAYEAHGRAVTRLYESHADAVTRSHAMEILLVLLAAASLGVAFGLLTPPG